MEYQFQDDHIPSYHTGEADLVLSYMDGPRDPDHAQHVFSRYIKADIVEENDDEVVLEREVSDNVNGGMFWMGDITEDYPGGEKIVFSETLRIRREKDYERLMEGAAIQMPLRERITPEVKEWNESTEFRSEPKPVPEDFKL